MFNDRNVAIDHYHALIARNPAESEAQLKALVDAQMERKISFGDRPLSTSLRPAFITDKIYTHIQDTVYSIRQAVLKIAAEFFNDREALNELGLTEEELELAAIPTNVIRLSVTSRMDAFMTGNSFKFVEINGEVPAGICYLHHLAKVYRELPLFKEFASRYPVRFVSPMQHLLAGLLLAYHEEFEGTEEKPSFAIVDFLDVPTYNEFILLKEYLESFGYPCEIADPRELEIKDGWIYANGRKIDIIYRRLLTNEFLDIKDECKAYFEGYVAQKTCYLNTFRSKLVHKKAIFSFLTDPKYTRILNSVQLQAIRNHIPWTRKLTHRSTNFKGRVVDLVDMVRKNKNIFVIKPNDEYGGKGVVLGRAVDSNTWDAAIETGLANGFVVQEIVEIHREPFLMHKEGCWEMMPTVVDLAPYLNGPLLGGCLTRTSYTDLANVTSGGGTLPMFILRYM